MTDHDVLRGCLASRWKLDWSKLVGHGLLVQEYRITRHLAEAGFAAAPYTGRFATCPSRISTTLASINTTA